MGGTVSGVAGDTSAALGVAGTVGTVAALLGKTALVTILGVTAAAAIWIGAVAGALVTLFVVFDFWRDRCLTSPRSMPACTAGVIEEIVPAFSSATDELFPFTAMHDRVDVVVKKIYWYLVEYNAQWVFCNDDPDSSPILRGYYKSSQVCAAGAGATIGGAAGAVAGIIAGAAVAAAIGCATIILCLLAILVALIIAAAAVIVGAFLGGQVGKAVAGDTPPSADGGNVLSVGDYVTDQGGLITSGDDEGARVYWFVDHTTLHGRSTGSPPFSHKDPDRHLTNDACPPPPVQ